MKLRITKGLVAISLVSFIVLLSGLAFVVQLVIGESRAYFTADAVLVISMGAAELHQRSATPTPEEVEDSILVLVNAGVIHGGLDAQKRPVDVYGTPFRVRHTVEGRLHRVTATSAGPDRQFDTPDDICRDATWENLASPAKQ